MAITFIIIDFEKEVANDSEDILNYLGWIPEIAGKPDVKGIPHMWDLNFGFDFPIHGMLFRLLEEEVSVPYLTVVIYRAIPEGTKEGDAVYLDQMAKLSKIVDWINQRFDYTLTPEDVDTFLGAEGTVGYQFNVDLTPMVNDLADSRRGSFKPVK
jgi:hypothetical protein